MKDMFEYYKTLIEEKYAQTVSVEAYRKALSVYGRNTAIATGVEEMVWLTGGSETLPTDNDITHFASSNAGDDQVLGVEGHTIDEDGLLTYVYQTVTLAGQTKTALGTPLARITNVENLGATVLAGTVTFSQDVTYTTGVPASDIHLTLNGTDNRSLKGAFSTSNNEYAIITSIQYSLLRQAAANVDFRIQVRNNGGVFKTVHSASIGSGTRSFEKDMKDSPIIVPLNSDVRVLATSSVDSTQVEVDVRGVLAEIIVR